MIMRILQNRTNSSHFVHPHAGATQWLPLGSDEGLFKRAIQSLKGKLIKAYNRQLRKTELQDAVEHLHGLTDEQLLDMGITRMDISHVVHHGKDQV
jgi:uncharacterized protein YjiS (DUF1127 family)